MSILITGANKNLGSTLSLELAKLGYDLVLVYDKDDDAKEKCVNNLSKYNVNILWYKVDISDEEKVKEMYVDLNNKGIRLDGLVNNAAIYQDNDIKDKDAKEFSKVLNNNVLGTYLVTKYAIPLLNDSSSIVNVSSTNALDTNYPEAIDYDASKAGIISLTKDFAKYLSPKVRVNTVCPGWIMGPSMKEMNEEFKKEELSKIYLQRFATEEEVANVIIFLLSAKASYVNNTIIRVDGGM